MPQANGERGQHDQDGTLDCSFGSKRQEQVRKASRRTQMHDLSS